MSKEREAFEAWVIENLAEGRSMSWEDWCWKAWQAAKAQAVPEGFTLVSHKELLDLTVAINAVDLATHTESKTNEVREMWQQVALKLMALGSSDCPDEP